MLSIYPFIRSFVIRLLDPVMPSIHLIWVLSSNKQKIWRFWRCCHLYLIYLSTILFILFNRINQSLKLNIIFIFPIQTTLNFWNIVSCLRLETYLIFANMSKTFTKINIGIYAIFLVSIILDRYQSIYSHFTKSYDGDI